MKSYHHDRYFPVLDNNYVGIITPYSPPPSDYTPPCVTPSLPHQVDPPSSDPRS